MIRASPYPLIPELLGKSETRRVPAPSHPAQRDVAKTHILQADNHAAPGAEPIPGSPWLGGRVDLEVSQLRIDNPKSIAESGVILKAKRSLMDPIMYLFC